MALFTDPSDPTPNEDSGLQGVTAQVTSFAPDSGLPGTSVEVFGKNLALSDTVLGGIVAQVVASSDTRLVFEVPNVSPGRYRLLIDGFDVGEFSVLEEVGACPNVVQDGGAVELQLGSADAVREVQFVDGSGGVAASISEDLFDEVVNGAVAIRVPAGLPPGTYTVRLLDGENVISTARMDVTNQTLPGPPSPQRILYPDPTTSYIPPLTFTPHRTSEVRAGVEDWFYYITFRSEGGSTCEGSGTLGIQEYPGVDGGYDSEDGNFGEGTWDFDANQIVFTIDRDGIEETYRGEFGNRTDNGATFYAEGTMDIVVRSDRTCRQLAIRTRAGCVTYY